MVSLCHGVYLAVFNEADAFLEDLVWSTLCILDNAIVLVHRAHHLA